MAGLNVSGVQLQQAHVYCHWAELRQEHRHNNMSDHELIIQSNGYSVSDIQSRRWLRHYGQETVE